MNMSQDSKENGMTKDVRMATRRDYHALVKVREEWNDRFCGAHRAEERWCPAQAQVSCVEDNATLIKHLQDRESDRWVAVLTGQGETEAYMLCQTDKDKSELLIERHNPRVSPRIQLEEAGSKLLEFVIRYACEQGLQRVSVFFHGFPDEVDPLMSLYRKLGFEGHPRFEMVSRQLAVDRGPQHLQFRSAEEIGLDAFHEIDGMLHGWSVEQSKKNSGISRAMWCIEPGTDWLVAYEGLNLVGTVQVAVTHEGVGVLDYIAIVEEYRGRGLGRCLLTRGLSALVGRTEVVWLDVDHDNIPAVWLYKRAGFQVHHHHGGMTKETHPCQM